jgi:hypothetical protein
MEIPTIEPTSIRSGDTTSWSKSFADTYPPSSGWALVYTLVLQSDASKRLQVTSTDSNNIFLATISAAQSAALTPGTYSLFGHVSKASERYQVFVGTVEVLPNIAAVLTGDIRSSVKRTLDAIEAVIERRATSDQQSMTINGRSLSRIPVTELIVLRDRYRTDYNAELAKEQLGRTGLDTKNIGVRFVRI